MVYCRLGLATVKTATFAATMSNTAKTQQKILQKLGIERLNPMQEEAQAALQTSKELILLSPTGSGKTLAFLLPILEKLDAQNKLVQCLIVVPTRELAIQIEQVAREMGSGYKINCVYGGRPISKDFMDLEHAPAILIGTPGRIADHLDRATLEITDIKTLVLDEFDKSLEIGFEEEMRFISECIEKSVETKILTSATEAKNIPDFVGLQKPLTINYLHEKIEQLQLQTIYSPSKDKLETLVALLSNLEGQSGIVFCNFKDSIRRVADFLDEKNIAYGVFYGGLEQKDRERSLIKFRNGTHQIILATDLAARGLDVPEIKFIIHYHLPLKLQEFTHRNGRTARMNSDGTAYIIQYENEDLPAFITDKYPETKDGKTVEFQEIKNKNEWSTIFISGGRRDKISKGDIAGFLIKKGNLKDDELGVIELKQDCAFVAVAKNKVNSLINKINDTHLKKRKVRVYEI